MKPPVPWTPSLKRRCTGILRRCTRIVIAHRLHTIRDADLILVLEDGTIVERGAHAALLAQRGHYAALVQSQMEIDAVATAIAVTG
jgi:ABC-type multidrug transport system fused ATPase/permease subunit